MGRQFYITFYEALDENNKRENGMLIKLILKRKHKSKFILGCKKDLILDISQPGV